MVEHIPSNPSDPWLPCPFCGGTDIRNDRHPGRGSGLHRGEDVFTMCCYHCGATFPGRYRLQLLLEAWNRRTPAPETVDVHSLPNGIILQRIKDAIGPELFDMQSGATWLRAIEAVTSPSANARSQ